MIYKIPKEFKIPMGVYKDDNDRVEFKYEEYSKSIYEIITSKIKEIWNYEIVEDVSYTSSIFVRRLDDCRYLLNGENIWIKTQYDFDGILTYDRYFNRFVIFQFRKNFNYSEVLKHINLGINYLKEIRENITLYFNNEYLCDRDTSEINYDLTKLIIIYQESKSSELLKYLTPNSSEYNRILELWKLTEVDNEVTILEKIKVDYKEELYIEEGISENEYFTYFELDKETINNYFLLKEYLKFKFTGHLLILLYVDTNKVDEFISNSYGNYYPNNEEDWFNLRDQLIFGKSSDNELQITQSFLNRFVDHYNDLFVNVNSKIFQYKREKLLYQNCLDYMKYSINIDVETHEWESIKFLEFTLSIKNKEIIINEEFGSLKLNRKIKPTDIQSFVNKTFEYYEYRYIQENNT